jgi:queuosine biosynthesis protein QueD
MITQALLHTDGGSRGNPGPSGIGFTIEVDDGRGLETICDGGAFIGTATNNQAEYQALIWGLRNALALDVSQLTIHADSELMVKQILGSYKVKNEALKPLFLTAKQLLAKFNSYNISHVFRSDNSQADTLANQAMDKQATVGNYRTDFTQPTNSLFNTLSSSQCAPNPHLSSPRDGATEGERSEQNTTLSSPRLGEAEGERSSRNAGDPQPPLPQESENSMYTLTVTDHFDAAHALIGYPGECKNLHGHTWDIEVSVQGTQLDDVGIIYDFKDLKRQLAAILKNYDHQYLNEVAPFDTINATAENLARIIYQQLEVSLPSGINLVEVVVWESPIAKLSYRK